MFKLIHILLLGLYSFVVNAKVEKNIHVYSWPITPAKNQVPPQEWGIDPIFGRLVCPVLSRFNPVHKSFDPLIFSSIRELEISSDAYSHKWLLEIRRGLYWWDNSQLSAKDINSFLTAEMPPIVDKVGGGLWDLPQFKITTLSDISIEIKWKKKPSFGPYILNNIPLWKKYEDSNSSISSSKLTFQCVGIFKPSFELKKTTLSPNSGYGYNYPKIVFFDDKKYREDHDKPIEVYDFQMADTLINTPKKRKAITSPQCSHKVSLPFFTSVIWNTHSPSLQHKEITHLIFLPHLHH